MCVTHQDEGALFGGFRLNLAINNYWLKSEAIRWWPKLLQKSAAITTIITQKRTLPVTLYVYHTTTIIQIRHLSQHPSMQNMTVCTCMHKCILFWLELDLHQVNHIQESIGICKSHKNFESIFYIKSRLSVSLTKAIKMKVQLIPTSVAVNSWRRRPSKFKPRSSALSPATIVYFGTSCETFRHMI